MKLIMAFLGALFFYKLQKYLYKKLWNKGLDVDLCFSKDAAIEGEEISLIETITNNKLLPLPILQIKFMTSRSFIFKDRDNSAVSDKYYRNDMTSVKMYQRLVKTLIFECSKRGYYTINRIDMVCSNLFLTQEHVSAFDLNIRLYVYPKPIEPLRLDATFSKVLGSVLTRRYINEDPFEFRNIREYQSYDGLKNINWKASAKTDALKVNVFDYTSSLQVVILLNTEQGTIWRYDDLNEESIRIASSMANILIGQGVPVALYTNARDLITKDTLELPAGSGSNHVQSIQRLLARIDLDLDPEPFLPLLHKSLIDIRMNDYIIILSHYQKEDLQELVRGLKRTKREFTWIVPTNKNIKMSICKELSEQIIEWELGE